jgi:curved DNA-binding protein CbpA
MCGHALLANQEKGNMTMNMTIYDAAKVLGLSGTITPQDIKTAYREACKKYHPDINPAGAEMMQIINAAYAVLKDFSGDIKEQQAGYSEAVNAALNAIYPLAGLVIEICGAWVWVTGNTREHKDRLKESGFMWASKKAAWYFRPEEYRSRSKGSSTLEEIREKYGSTRPQRSYTHMIGGAA